MPEAHYPKVGSVDELECFLGQRGTGKSTHMCDRILELASRAGGAYVIGHSLGQRLPESLPKELGGETLPLSYHATIRDLDKGLRKKPERWHVLAPANKYEFPDHVKGDAETADDLIKYAIRLSAMLRVRAWKKEHPFALTKNPTKMRFGGLSIPPIILFFDEGAAVAGAAQSKTSVGSSEFREFLFSLRHMHIAMYWCLQDPNAKTYMMMSQATLIHVHHTSHQYAVNAIRAAGASEEQLEAIEDLSGYEHVTIEVSATKRHDEAAPPVTKADVDGERDGVPATPRAVSS
jgi:hypothetical protein